VNFLVMTVTMMKCQVTPYRRSMIACLLLFSAVVGHTSVMTKDKHKRQNQVTSAEHSNTPVTLLVTPRFAMVGGSAQAVVRVSPAVENRRLRITVDSPDYFRSSDVTLDGADSARTHFVPLQSLTAGSYEVLAVVYGTQGERGRSEQKFDVLGAQEDRPTSVKSSSGLPGPNR
jgi:hypothetical protein